MVSAQVTESAKVDQKSEMTLKEITAEMIKLKKTIIIAEDEIKSTIQFNINSHAKFGELALRAKGIVPRGKFVQWYMTVLDVGKSFVARAIRIHKVYQYPGGKELALQCKNLDAAGSLLARLEGRVVGPPHRVSLALPGMDKVRYDLHSVIRHINKGKDSDYVRQRLQTIINRLP